MATPSWRPSSRTSGPSPRVRHRRCAPSSPPSSPRAPERLAWRTCPAWMFRHRRRRCTGACVTGSRVARDVWRWARRSCPSPFSARGAQAPFPVLHRQRLSRPSRWSASTCPTRLRGNRVPPPTLGRCHRRIRADRTAPPTTMRRHRRGTVRHQLRRRNRARWDRRPATLPTPAAARLELRPEARPTSRSPGRPGSACPTMSQDRLATRRGPPTVSRSGHPREIARVGPEVPSRT
jgi:hypothetical protein